MSWAPRWPQFFTQACVYVAFLLVGTASGFFVLSGLLNLIANEPSVAKEGRMMGEVTFIGSIVSLVQTGAFLLGKWWCGPPSIRAEQMGSTMLMVLSILFLALLAAAWDVFPPGYPIVALSAAAGNIILNGSMLVLNPLLATHYGGWLVAPVRAGTDISGMLATFLSELQSPVGLKDLFPTWYLFASYAVFSCFGLVAWLIILRYGIGLRGESSLEKCEAKAHESEDAPLEPQASSWLDGFRCPRCLLWPVALACLAEVAQLSLAQALGQIGAEMTDPLSCGGPDGRRTWRFALALSQFMGPLGTLASCMGECPRWLFNGLCLLLYLSCFLICSAAFGLGRGLWTTPEGERLYTVCIGICAGVEAYVITMAYRYIGDAKDLLEEQKSSAGALLSVLAVLVPGLSNLVIGPMVTADVITCVNL
mmetsp:Transcript_42209/g.78524  ORF Transcript_42209/g.78524 Transcript_42209/m.78524 type:complete len:422 (-) Transcript_42209:313-1578(-)